MSQEMAGQRVETAAESSARGQELLAELAVRDSEYDAARVECWELEAELAGSAQRAAERDEAAEAELAKQRWAMQELQRQARDVRIQLMEAYEAVNSFEEGSGSTFPSAPARVEAQQVEALRTELVAASKRAENAAEMFDSSRNKEVALARLLCGTLEVAALRRQAMQTEEHAVKAEARGSRLKAQVEDLKAEVQQLQAENSGLAEFRFAQGVGSARDESSEATLNLDNAETWRSSNSKLYDSSRTASSSLTVPNGVYPQQEFALSTPMDGIASAGKSYDGASVAGLSPGSPAPATSTAPPIQRRLHFASPESEQGIASVPMQLATFSPAEQRHSSRPSDLKAQPASGDPRQRLYEALKQCKQDILALKT